MRMLLALILVVFSMLCVWNCKKDNQSNTFEAVSIGTQIWMKLNLDVDHYRNGDPIPLVEDSSEWNNLKIGAWCYYDNNSGNDKIYGKLYNWYAVNDPRGLAPEGWHIPSEAEWTLLADYLGGEDITGGKLKETDTAYWQEPNTGATNESGFRGLPGGIRFEYGGFDFLTQHGVYWSSTVHSTYGVRCATMYVSKGLSIGLNSKKYGFSVRCIKN